MMRTFHARWALAILCLFLAACQNLPTRQTPEQSENTGPDPQKIVAASMQEGDIAFRRGDSQRAIYHYMMAAQAKPEDAAPYLRIARVHEYSNRPEAAEQAYRLALARTPDSLDAQEGLGVMLLKQGKSADAKTLLSAVAAADVERWRAQNSLGVIADMAGDYTAARTHYRAAMQANGDAAMVLNNFGYSYYLDNDWVSAERLFNQVVEKNPKYWPAWSNLALVRVRQERYDEAKSIFRQFMPEHEALNMLGYLCTLSGDYKSAERFLNRATEVAPAYYKDAYDNLDYLRHKM